MQLFVTTVSLVFVHDAVRVTFWAESVVCDLCAIRYSLVLSFMHSSQIVTQGVDMFSKTMLAYLDAGTGSILLAALAGGVAGLRLFIGHVWAKLARRKRIIGDRSKSSTDKS